MINILLEVWENIKNTYKNFYELQTYRTLFRTCGPKGFSENFPFILVYCVFVSTNDPFGVLLE